MDSFTLSFIVVLGLAIGSFLNVVIDRLPQGKSIIRGRSYCDFCRHTLAWYDLIPILSFIILGRKCRYCKKSISWQYPIVELVTAILFIIVFASINRFIDAPSYLPIFFFHLVVISGLIVIFFTDLKYRIIPDQVVLFLIILILLYLFINRTDIWLYLLSGLTMSSFLLMLLLITRGRGMGLGDVKFAFLMGLILGFPSIIIAFYLSFLTGALFSLILILSGKKTIKATIPFGPFLAVATIVSLFYGQSLWRLFKGILGI